MSEAETDLVRVTERGSTAWVTLNRERKLNALSPELLSSLSQAIGALEENSGIRCVVLTGDGARAFCAGADLKRIKSASAGGFITDNMFGHRVFAQIRRSPLPFIAAINGVAVGGGLELALSCDIRIAVRTAQLGLPEVSVGVLPGWGGTWRLAEAVGAAKARELVLTGEKLAADEALRLGLVSQVAEDIDALRAEAQKLADRIAGNSAASVSYAKSLLNYREDPAGVQAMAETGYVATLLESAHFKEATSGF